MPKVVLKGFLLSSDQKPIHCTLCTDSPDWQNLIPRAGARHNFRRLRIFGDVRAEPPGVRGNGGPRTGCINRRVAAADAGPQHGRVDALVQRGQRGLLAWRSPEQRGLLVWLRDPVPDGHAARRPGVPPQARVHPRLEGGHRMVAWILTSVAVEYTVCITGGDGRLSQESCELAKRFRHRPTRRDRQLTVQCAHLRSSGALHVRLSHLSGTLQGPDALTRILPQPVSSWPCVDIRELGARMDDTAKIPCSSHCWYSMRSVRAVVLPLIEWTSESLYMLGSAQLAIIFAFAGVISGLRKACQMVPSPRRPSENLSGGGKLGNLWQLPN
ncbi:hypothetical protein GGX14DRAFT_406592 [Mycena pura]|uniref:Uncharacterized protein n=1 Tax=Mycena pura TaxID=153505 RepID=A0AAD6Y5B7_9AGAR|nr:hypothetical protein GGX14DRAFT_406592 [Mycena pura]